MGVESTQSPAGPGQGYRKWNTLTVSARTITSRPPSMHGMACIWTGVGCCRTKYTYTHFNHCIYNTGQGIWIPDVLYTWRFAVQWNPSLKTPPWNGRHLSLPQNSAFAKYLNTTFVPFCVWISIQCWQVVKSTWNNQSLTQTLYSEWGFLFQED